MNEDERTNKLIQIADHYGLDLQIEQTWEELDELETALADFRIKNLNDPSDLLTPFTPSEKEEALDNLIEELADVSIMTEQLIYLLDEDEVFLKMVDYKLNRQIERIEGERK